MEPGRDPLPSRGLPGASSDGTLEPRQGHTGPETILAEIAKSIFTQTIVTLIADFGSGPLLVLGNADIANQGTPSDAGVRY